MASELREWPNKYGRMRDDMAELIRGEIVKLERITSNQVNDEEEMETIAMQVISDLNVILRSLEVADARTDPLSELEYRAKLIKHLPAQAIASA